MPDYRTWTQRDYGNRVGIFRVLDVLDRYQIRAGVAVNALAAERYPYLVEQFKKRNYEFIAHGHSANRMITSKMSEAEERAEIAEAIAAIDKAAGVRPKGWLGQDYGESQRTPKLLADAGLDYVLDWPNDDQPYPMKVGKKFVSLPSQPEWDDVQQLWLRRINTTRYPDLVGEAFELMHQEGGHDPSLADGHAAPHKISRRGAAPDRALRQCLAHHAGRNRPALRRCHDGLTFFSIRLLSPKGEGNLRRMKARSIAACKAPRVRHRVASAAGPGSTGRDRAALPARRRPLV